jgi:hypothetical protein
MIDMFNSQKHYLFSLLLLSIIIFQSCSDDKSSIVQPDPPDDPEIPFVTRLFDLEGVSITALGASDGFENIYQIDIFQPVDHNNPDGQQFTQRLYLSHRDENLPMIIETSGYQVSRNRIRDLSHIINANKIIVSHRYTGNSLPNHIDWQYLNAYQASSDHHRIYELFSTLYDSSWISFGVSKGGQTALFYKRYYPNDVDAVVTYVAPLPNGPQESSIGQYIESLGPPGCYQSIIDFQRYCINHRDSLIPYAQAVYDNDGLTYSEGVETGVLHQILEYPIAFWQIAPSNCTSIPDSTNSYQEIYNHLQTENGLQLYSDQYINFYAPAFYQIFAENGYYEYPIDSLTEALNGIDPPLSSDLVPSYLSPVTYNPTTMIELKNYLNTNGNNIIYVYGADDPWTGAAYEPTGSTNAIKIIQQGFDHSVTISDLDNRNIIYNALDSWLGITVNRL